jgi:uncharacterized protein YfaS (alpha-2-macroglobulin family)
LDKTVISSKLHEAVAMYKKSNDFYGNFYTREIGPAMCLIACMRVLPADPIIDRLVVQLLSDLKGGYWHNTCDTAWALSALGEYYKGTKFGEDKVKCSVKNAQGKTWSFEIPSKSSYIIQLDAADFLEKPGFSIESDTKNMLEYKLELNYPRLDYSQKGFSDGFEIEKTIENTAGTKKIVVGDIVKIKIRIKAQDNYHNVMLDDPLPAGLVAINSALKTEEVVPEQSNNSKDDYYWYNWNEDGCCNFIPNYFEIKNDRVLAYREDVYRWDYEYTYYARAVCAGEFVMVPTKVELMYDPETVAVTPAGKFVIVDK